MQEITTVKILELGQLSGAAKRCGLEVNNVCYVCGYERKLEAQECIIRALRSEMRELRKRFDSAQERQVLGAGLARAMDKGEAGVSTGA